LGKKSLECLLLFRKSVARKTGLYPSKPHTREMNLAEIPEKYAYSSAAFYLENIEKHDFLTHFMEG
jgi:hypothetical protein